MTCVDCEVVQKIFVVDEAQLPRDFKGMVVEELWFLSRRHGVFEWHGDRRWLMVGQRIGIDTVRAEQVMTLQVRVDG